VLWGATHTAKTVSARSLGRHCYFKGWFDEEKYDDRCDYVVFDDMQHGLLSIPYRDWLGKKEYIVVDAEGASPRKIRWARPCIFVQGAYPLLDRRVERKWMKENVTVVDVTSPLCDYE